MELASFFEFSHFIPFGKSHDPQRVVLLYPRFLVYFTRFFLPPPQARNRSLPAPRLLRTEGLEKDSLLSHWFRCSAQTSPLLVNPPLPLTASITSFFQYWTHFLSRSSGLGGRSLSFKLFWIPLSICGSPRTFFGSVRIRVVAGPARVVQVPAMASIRFPSRGIPLLWKFLRLFVLFSDAVGLLISHTLRKRWPLESWPQFVQTSRFEASKPFYQFSSLKGA